MEVHRFRLGFIGITVVALTACSETVQPCRAEDGGLGAEAVLAVGDDGIDATGTQARAEWSPRDGIDDFGSEVAAGYASHGRVVAPHGELHVGEPFYNATTDSATFETQLLVAFPADAPAGLVCDAREVDHGGMNPGCGVFEPGLTKSASAHSNLDMASCGNGVVDPGETCDPASRNHPCPTPAECFPAGPCETVALVGDGCQTECLREAIIAGAYDGCCPPGTLPSADPDCGCSSGEGCPVIYKVAPGYVSPGAYVTIRGTGFGESQADGDVLLGDAVIEVARWSDTVIVFRVPASSSGAVRVRVGDYFSNPRPLVIIQANAVIGAMGGMLTVSNPSSPIVGAALDVPANALAENTLLWLAPAVAFPTLPAGLEMLGPPVDTGPSGTVFAVGGVLTLPVYASRSFSDASEIRVLTPNWSLGLWDVIRPDAVTPTGVRVRIPHLSSYAVVGRTTGVVLPWPLPPESIAISKSIAIDGPDSECIDDSDCWYLNEGCCQGKCTGLPGTPLSRCEQQPKADECDDNDECTVDICAADCTCVYTKLETEECDPTFVEQAPAGMSAFRVRRVYQPSIGLEAEIVFPNDGSFVRGEVPIFGVAAGPRFAGYDLAFRPAPVENPGANNETANDDPEGWQVFARSDAPTSMVSVPSGLLVAAAESHIGNLGTLDTGLSEYVYDAYQPTRNLAGAYDLRLRVFGRDGSSAMHIVRIFVGRVASMVYGGIVPATDGAAALCIPEHALADDFQLFLLEPMVGEERPVPAGLTLAGRTYRLLPTAYRFGAPVLVEIDPEGRNSHLAQVPYLARYDIGGCMVAAGAELARVDKQPRGPHCRVCNFVEGERRWECGESLDVGPGPIRALFPPGVIDRLAVLCGRSFVDSYLVRTRRPPSRGGASATGRPLNITFEDGSTGGWESLDSKWGAALASVPCPGRPGRCLRLTRQGRGHFGSRLAGPFDLRAYPSLRFHYRVPPEVRIGLYLRADGVWYDLGFADDPKSYRRLNMHPLNPVRAKRDDRWHEVEIDLLSALQERRGDTVMVDEIVMADWDSSGPMSLTFGTGEAGARYFIDDVRLDAHAISPDSQQPVQRQDEETPVPLASARLVIEEFGSAERNHLGGIRWFIHSAQAQAEASVANHVLRLSCSGPPSSPAQDLWWCTWGTYLGGLDLRAYDHIEITVRQSRGPGSPHLYLVDRAGRRRFVDLARFGVPGRDGIVAVPLTAFSAQGVDLGEVTNLEIAYEWDELAGLVEIGSIAFSGTAGYAFEEPQGSGVAWPWLLASRGYSGAAGHRNARIRLSPEIVTAVRGEADYITRCQWMLPGAGYGAINNVIPEHGPTWVVPREMAMAILGLLRAAEVLGVDYYRERALVAADFLARIQSDDGSYCSRYEETRCADPGRSPGQVAQVLIALHETGERQRYYSNVAAGAEFLFSLLARPAWLTHGRLITGGTLPDGNRSSIYWTSDNSFAYQALKGAEEWALAHGEVEAADRYRKGAFWIARGLAVVRSLAAWSEPVWPAAVNAEGQPVDPNGRPTREACADPSWVNFAPKLLDLPTTVRGVDDPRLDIWLYSCLFQAGLATPYAGMASAWDEVDSRRARLAQPGLTFAAVLVWWDIGNREALRQAIGAAMKLRVAEADSRGIEGGFLEWIGLDGRSRAPEWQRFVDGSFYAIAALTGGFDFNLCDADRDGECDCREDASNHVAVWTDR